MFVNLNIHVPAFGELLRKCVFGFCSRLDNCKINNIIGSIARSSVVYNYISVYVGSGGTRFCIDMHSLVILFIYTTSIWCFYVYIIILLSASPFMR